MSEGWLIPGRMPNIRLRVWEIDTGEYRFSIERWSKYYEPSDEDAGPVVGGLWGGETSGLYATRQAAEAAGRAELHLIEESVS